MSEKENKPEIDEHDIDSLLADFNRQKTEHKSNFGELEAAEKSNKKENSVSESKDSENAEEKPKSFSESNAPAAEKSKAETAKNKKRVLLALAAVFCTGAVIAGIAFGISFSKTAYLRPYQKQYPDVKFPEGIREEYCEYYAGHTNLIGKISIPDCGFEDYVYTASNSCPVLDSNSGSRNLTYNTVVYVNNAGADFETAYSSAEAYLKSSQKITYSTLFDDYSFNVIGAFYTNSKPEDDNGYVFPYNLTSCPVGSDFDEYTDRLYHRFLYTTGRAVKKNDKLLTVAVKSDFMQDFRFVIVAVLDGETQKNALPNEKVHYPQAWYVTNNLTNPYRFSAQWYPTIAVNQGEETSLQSADDFTKF